MTFLLSFLYCFIGSLWACYWLEELCHGIYLDHRMWGYAWRMGGHILLWPIAAPYYLWYLGFGDTDYWDCFPDSPYPRRAGVILLVFGAVGFWLLCAGVRHLIS